MKIQEILAINGGSFAKAEQMALDLITKAGDQKVWLDLSLLLHAQGKIDGAKQAMASYAKLYPDCPRMRFGRAMHQLRDGNLTGGLEDIEAGREIGCFGDRVTLDKPRWDGKADLYGRVVLLTCEGGMGDQIMCVRAARWLAAMGGAKVVVACSAELMSLFVHTPGVSAVVSSEAAKGVHCDFWLPAMSAFRLMKRTWGSLWDRSYIFNGHYPLWERIIPKVEGTLNIGLRWSGNPKFEHEQLRRFPAELMFKVAETQGAKFYSLQKGDHSGILPDNVADLEPLLGDWCQTAAAVSRMDLVITSDTAIAHLAGAMNVPFWVIVPVMSYYPWAREGNLSAWYPSARIYRQECYGDWQKPFARLYDDFKAFVAAGR